MEASERPAEPKVDLELLQQVELQSQPSSSAHRRAALPSGGRLPPGGPCGCSRRHRAPATRFRAPRRGVRAHDAFFTRFREIRSLPW